MRRRSLIAPFVAALLAVAAAACEPVKTEPPPAPPLVAKYGTAGWAVGTQGVDAFLAARTAEIARPSRDAHLALRPDGSIEYTPAEAGLELDADASRAALASALAAGKPNVDLVTRAVAPRVPDAAVAEAHDQLVRIFDTSPSRSGGSPAGAAVAVPP